MNKKLSMIFRLCLLGFVSYNRCPPVCIMGTSDATEVIVPERLVNFSNTLCHFTRHCDTDRDTADPDGALAWVMNRGDFSSKDLRNCIQHLEALADKRDITSLLREQDLAANCKLLKTADFFDIPQLYTATITEIVYKLRAAQYSRNLRTKSKFMRLFDELPIHDINQEFKKYPFYQSEILRTTKQAGIRFVTFRPNSNQLATLSTNGMMRIWDTHTGKARLTLPEHLQTTYCEFSSYGNNFVTISRDGNIRIWDTETGKQLRMLVDATFFPHAKYFFSATFNSAGDRIVTTSSDGIIRIFDVQTGRCLRALNRYNRTHYRNKSCAEQTFIAALTPNDKGMVTISRDGTAYVLNASNGYLLFTLNGRPWHSVRSITHSYDGNRILTATSRGIHLWNIHSGELLRSIDEVTDYRFATFGHDDSQIFSFASDGVHVWDINSGTQSNFQQLDSTIIDATFSSNGKAMATILLDGTVSTWQNIPDLQTLYQLKIK